jgi:hypothetical protein
MYRFIVKAILFLLPLIAIIGWVDRRCESIPNTYARKRAILERNIDTVQIIVTGSSHAYYGIDTKNFEVPTVNVSFVSQGIYYDTQILRKYMSVARSLKIVVIPISYFSFEAGFKDDDQLARVGFYTKIWDIPPPTSGFKLHEYGSIALFGLQPCREFAFRDRVISNKAISAIDEWGNSLDVLPIDPERATSKVSVKRHTKSEDERTFSASVAILDTFLAELEERNIKAVFVTTPVLPIYHQNMDEAQYQRMLNTVQTLSGKYGVKYANYLKDERFTLDDFYDSDHLRISGAEKFSGLLWEEVLRSEMQFLRGDKK